VHPFIFVGTRKHPVTIIPDYTLIHDNQVLLILDAKSPTEDVLTRNHVQQAYSYAIHPEISRAPYQALADLVIELDIEVHLGSETRGQHESFVPLIISKILAARFNPSPMPVEPTDRPPHIFRLRNAFEIKQKP